MAEITTDKSPLLWRLLKAAILASVAVAVLIWPAAWLLEQQARTVQLIAPFDEAVIGVNRFEYEDEPSGNDEDVVAIYGTAFGEPEAVLFVDESRILHPKENPKLSLFAKAADENPFKVDSLGFIARFVSIGAGLAALALVILLGWLRRRRARAGTPLLS